MYVSRDDQGRIVGRYAIAQSTDQEELADDAPELTLDAARASKRVAIDTAFARALAQGLPFADKVIQIDGDSRANIAAAATRAMAVALGIPSMTWPEDFYWRTADNSPMLLTAEQMLALGQAAADRYSALIYRRGALKDAVDAAETAEGVEDLDATSGWD